MRSKLGLMILGLMLLAPLCASAQSFKFGGGVRAGILGYDQSELTGKKLYWGFHGRVRVMKYLGGEISYQTREDTFRIHNGELKLRTTPTQFSGIVYPLAMLPVTPYFVFGTGHYQFTLTATGDLGLPYIAGEGTLKVSENAPHIGVGVEAFLGDHVSFGGDIRKVTVKFHNPIVSGLQITGIKLDAYLVNLTATFYF